MKSEITSVLFLLHVLLVTLMVKGRIETLSCPIKQVAGDRLRLQNKIGKLKKWSLKKKSSNLIRTSTSYHAGRNASVNAEEGTTE